MTVLRPLSNLRLAAAVVAAAGALSCGESLGPGAVAGVYVLRVIGSDSLPAVASSNENATVIVRADTIRLAPDGAGVEVGLREVVPAGGAPVEVVRVEWPLYYEYDHGGFPPGRIELTYVCPPNALCVAGPHLVGVRTPDGLRVESTFGDGLPWSYQRVAPPLLPVHGAP